MSLCLPARYSSWILAIGLISICPNALTQTPYPTPAPPPPPPAGGQMVPPPVVQPTPPSQYIPGLEPAPPGYQAAPPPAPEPAYEPTPQQEVSDIDQIINAFSSGKASGFAIDPKKPMDALVNPDWKPENPFAASGSQLYGNGEIALHVMEREYSGDKYEFHAFYRMRNDTQYPVYRMVLIETHEQLIAAHRCCEIWDIFGNRVIYRQDRIVGAIQFPLVSLEVARWESLSHMITAAADKCDKKLLAHIVMEVKKRNYLGAYVAKMPTRDITDSPLKLRERFTDFAVVRRTQRKKWKEWHALTDAQINAMIANPDGECNDPIVELPPPQEYEK